MKIYKGLRGLLAALALYLLWSQPAQAARGLVQSAWVLHCEGT